MHGGASTGAKTLEGRERISQANLRHGNYTKDKLEKQRMNAAKGREIRKELRKIEQSWSTAVVGQAYGEGYSLEKKWEWLNIMLNYEFK